MKKTHLLLLSLLVITSSGIACSKKDDSEKFEEKNGRRQVLSDKKDVIDTTPEPTANPYIMRLENQTLTLYEIIDGEENAVRAINIDTSYYPPEDIKELNEGILAYSKEEGFLRMENFSN